MKSERGGCRFVVTKTDGEKPMIGQGSISIHLSNCANVVGRNYYAAAPSGRELLITWRFRLVAGACNAPKPPMIAFRYKLSDNTFETRMQKRNCLI